MKGPSGHQNAEDQIHDDASTDDHHPGAHALGRERARVQLNAIRVVGSCVRILFFYPLQLFLGASGIVVLA